jgi:hypothetical protein
MPEVLNGARRLGSPQNVLALGQDKPQVGCTQAPPAESQEQEGGTEMPALRKIARVLLPAKGRHRR